ncbi:MAG: hypothetical protein GX612_00225 [Bacteroidales bacterium]|jgi:hypothetical protein|nr:hypothetical protein [Bacteroidales bacterium]
MHLFFFDYIYIFINKKNILLHNEIKIIINLNLKKMRKGILCLAVVALLAVFPTSCKPDVVITAPESIEIELGSTDADVLKDVTASSKDEVTVTGVNYDHAGEQTATFAAGDATLDKVVKVKTTKLAGTYEFTIDDSAALISCTITQSETDYNKININGNLLGLGELMISAFGQGNVLTMEEFEMELTGGDKVPVTGVGSFEKLESGVYQVKEMTITVTYGVGDTEEYVLAFEKK